MVSLLLILASLTGASWFSDEFKGRFEPPASSPSYVITVDSPSTNLMFQTASGGFQEGLNE